MDYKLDNYLVGTKLREFRLKASMTLAQASEAIGVSAAFISMVENGKSGISFSKLHALLTCYGRTFSDLSNAPDDDTAAVNITAANMIAAEEGVRILGLAKASAAHNVGGFYLYYQPGASNQFDYHSGMDYVFVVDGEFELTLRNPNNAEAAIHPLVSGDTMVYPSTLGHSYKNIGSRVGILFIVEISD